MTIDADRYSPAFRELFETFQPETYAHSMGRGAEQALPLFEQLSDEEKTLIADWLYALFSEKCEYRGKPYMDLIALTKDSRFVPLIRCLVKDLEERGSSITLIDRRTGDSVMYVTVTARPWVIATVSLFPFLSPLFKKTLDGTTPMLAQHLAFSNEIDVCLKTLDALITA